MINIYKYRTQELRAVVEPDSQSIQQQQIMGLDVVLLSFSLPLYINFQRGDYARVFGRLYKLNIAPSVSKIANRNWEYRLTFESETYDLGKVLYLFLNAQNLFSEVKFPMKSTPLGFLQLVIYNLERMYPSAGWKIGYVVDAPEKLLEFDSKNCLEALGILAEAFGTEYLIEGKTISLYQKQLNSGMVFSYGEGEALKSISRDNQDNSNRITRLYAYGGDKNIGSNYRNGAQRLRLANGLYVEKGTDQYETIEGTKIFEDIYPHRTGTITSVADPFNFTDSSINFNINDYLMPGIAVQLTFNTGMLAGYTFDVGSYNSLTKTIRINKNTEEQTLDVPSALMTPAVGDQYVLTNLLMPLSYVNDGESDLQTAGLSELDLLAADKQAFKVDCNALWFKLQNNIVQIGQTVRLDIPEMELDRQIRIMGYTRNLRQPALYSMELADTVKVNTLVKLINGIR